MKGEPDFLSNLRQEFADHRVWLDRLVVAGFAVAAGAAVVGFTLLADGAFELFLALQGRWPWFTLLWTPALTAAVVWATRRWFAAASGSGVPQVVAALDPRLEEGRRGLLVSVKLSAAKVLAVSGGLLAGLSIGRQGPSVQVAAGIMFSARHWLSPRSGISARELLVAGGAAGIAAAFNTPLGGIVFAIEELSRRLEQRSSGLMLAAIVIAGLVAVSALGNLAYFGRIHIEAVGWRLLAPGLLVALASGLLGGLMARLLVASLTGLPDRFCAYRRKRPVSFAALCGLAVAAIGLLTQASALGGGHHHTRELLAGQAEPLPIVWTWLKFVASWLSAWAGMPGGIFGPSLAIGAGIGSDVAWLIAPQHQVALIALGMAGFLAAVTQTPITAMIIVMEMVDGYAMVLSLMACALLASLVSRLVSRPLYPTLADLMLRQLAPPAAAGPGPAAATAASGPHRPETAPHSPPA
ncbi:chloride channel protein [Ramlibacter sp. 2FC]|uniref:chloride channel protein n=1 Tax=Ramlibacter sp. 2FC TaxID=2502188 RepID=UPI0010F84238|nr:chloride channel protein [Ramlibacter sp. 2FC]